MTHLNRTPEQIDSIISKLDKEIAEYWQDLKNCNPSDKLQIAMLKDTIENANKKLSRLVMLKFVKRVIN